MQIIITMRTLWETLPSGGTHISQAEGDFQIIPEHVAEVWIHVKHFKQVIPEDLVKVAVGQSPDVRTGFPWPSIQIDGLTKDVILSYIKHSKRKDTHGDNSNS